MRILLHLDLRAHFRDSPVVHELRRIHPDAWQGDHGYVVLPETDPRMHYMLRVLEQAGYSAHAVRQVPPTEPTTSNYYLWYSREYDLEDLAGCQYLRMIPEYNPSFVWAGNETVYWDYRNTEWLAGESLIAADTENFCVPNKIKKIIESAAIHNVYFTETRPELQGGKPTDWSKVDAGPPWWVMHTDVVMPPMAPSMILYDGYWKRVEAGDPSAMFVFDPVDPRIGQPELHYRAADLAAMEPFDIAKTFEKYRAVIVSKKFYTVCRALDLKVKWIPVRIEG